MRREACLGVGDGAAQDVVVLPLVAVADPDGALLLRQERDRPRELVEAGAGTRA